MPNKKVYFGTLDDMQWVPAPQANSTYNRVSWRASGTFLNGGGYQRQSGTSHKEMSLSWSVQKLEMIDKVLAQFNKGEMLYYIDPIAAKYNVLPPYVAQYQPDNPQGVDFVDTGSAGALGYPRKAAVYSGANTLATVPVPAGQNLWVGAHGNAIGGGGVAVAGDGSGTPEVLSTRTNLVQNGRAKYTSGTVEVRRNGVRNPMLRTNSIGWSEVGPFTGEWIQNAGSESNFFRATAKTGGAAPDSGGIQIGQQGTDGKVEVIPGTTVQFSVLARCSVSTRVGIRYAFYDASSNIIGSVINSTYSAVVLSPGVSKRITTEPLMVPTGAVYAFFRIQLSSGEGAATIPAGGTLDGGRATTAGPPYFDGNFQDPADPDLTPSWAGTANASASVLTGKKVVSLYNDIHNVPYQTVDDAGTAIVSLWDEVPGPNGVWWQIGVIPQYKWIAVSFIAYHPDGPIMSIRMPVAQERGSSYRYVTLVPTTIIPETPTRFTGVAQLTYASGNTIGIQLPVAVSGKTIIREMIVGVADTEAEALAAVQTYFDGDTANKQDGLVTTTYTWNGTAGQASSTETVTYNPNATVSVPMLSTSDVQRVNTKVQGGQNLTISTTGTGAVQLNGLIAQILPEGETPEPGGFISGQGHSGLRLNSDPMVTQYSVSIPNAQIGVSAEFIETGAWE